MIVKRECIAHDDVCEFGRDRPEVTAYVPGFGLFFRPELNLRATLAKPSGLHG